MMPFHASHFIVARENKYVCSVKNEQACCCVWVGTLETAQQTTDNSSHPFPCVSNVIMLNGKKTLNLTVLSFKRTFYFNMHRIFRNKHKFGALKGNCRHPMRVLGISSMFWLKS